MKTTSIIRKAKDGKLFHTCFCNIADKGEPKEWIIDYDTAFSFSTRKECETNARLRLSNQVEDYEYDNNLR